MPEPVAALTAADVEQATFPAAFRGFDQHRVQGYLAEVAGVLRTLETDRARLRAELDDTRSRDVRTVDTADPEFVRRIDERIHHLVTDAEERAADIVRVADSRAAQVVREAQDEARRLRDGADGERRRAFEAGAEDAERLLAAADAHRAEVETDLAGARAALDARAAEARRDGERRGDAEARRIVAEAEAVREKVLGDLTRRRKAARQQLEQLAAARDVLLGALASVRATVDEATTDLRDALPRARHAGAAAARRVDAEDDPTPAELDAEISALRMAGLSLGAAADEPADDGDAVVAPDVEAVLYDHESEALAADLADRALVGDDADDDADDAEDGGRSRPVRRARRRRGRAPVLGLPEGELHRVEASSPFEDVRVVPPSTDVVPTPDAHDPPPWPPPAVADQVAPDPDDEAAVALDEPEPEDVVEREPEPEPEPEDVVEPEPEVESTAEPERAAVVAEPEPHLVAVEPDVEPDPGPGVVAVVDPGSVAAVEPDPGPGVVAVVDPGSVAAIEPDPGPEVVAAVEPGPEPEPVEAVPAAHDPADTASSTAEVAARTGRTRGDLDALFARLRGTPTAPAPEVAPEPVDVAATTDPAPVGKDAFDDASVGSPDVADGGDAPVAAPPTAPPVDDGARVHLGGGDDRDALVARRDEVMAPLLADLARRVKRQLADEQNELLDGIRRVGRAELVALVPRADDVAAWRAAVDDVLDDAVAAGAAFLGADPATVDPARRTAVLDAQLRAVVLAPLRARLRAAVEGAEDDRDAAVEAVRSRYREWRSQRIDDVAGHLARTAFALGGHEAAPPGTPLCWIADDGGVPCPDAEDNALAGAVPRGRPFPTGDLLPPAHPGCRCFLAPAR